TISFLFYELARHPREQDLLLDEQDRLLDGRVPGAGDLAGALPRLEMVLDETLRLYPPAWIGPRRATDPFELLGRHVPRDAAVNYSSWASHRLPDVWSDPEAFVPERFEAEAKAALAKGAYVPFGGGSRTCVGMRFGQMEIRAIVTRILARFRLELQPGFQLDVRQSPTLSPRHGMPMRVRAHGVATASTLVD
ncbi:MAG: cytochrome P450, partial [Thermoleophilaceae bacterium]